MVPGKPGEEEETEAAKATAASVTVAAALEGFIFRTLLVVLRFILAGFWYETQLFTTLTVLYCIVLW